MHGRIFKKAIFISLLGHLGLFACNLVFSFSFGPYFIRPQNPGVNFWGAILSGSQVTVPSISQNALAKNIPALRVSNLDATLSGYSQASCGYLKPPVSLAFNPEKPTFAWTSAIPAPSFLSRKQSPVILHPLLPYTFPLYFNDRQVAHVELVFNITGSDLRRSMVVKRKISSGNLEVDLLSMRYISHYLFIRQAFLPLNSWQTVKIDLTAKP